jgi:hypothetical protein
MTIELEKVRKKVENTQKELKNQGARVLVVAEIMEVEDN